MWVYLKCMELLLVLHGFATSSFIEKSWFDSLCDCFCERWRQQPWNYAYNIIVYYWMWTSKTFPCLWRCLFWLCDFKNMSICNKWWQGLCQCKFGKCERCSSWFAKDNYLDTKIKQKEVKVGKYMHGKWDVTPKVENSY